MYNFKFQEKETPVQKVTSGFLNWACREVTKVKKRRRVSKQGNVHVHVHMNTN